MPAITPLPIHKLQNTVNSAMGAINQLVDANNAQGIVTLYSRLTGLLFSNPNGTPDETISQLSTKASAVLSAISSIGSLITSLDATVSLTAIPAFTANKDGSVSLTQVASPVSIDNPAPAIQ